MFRMIVFLMAATVSSLAAEKEIEWTPLFDGKTTKGWPITTIVNGNIVYNNEKLNLDILGKEVEFDS